MEKLCVIVANDETGYMVVLKPGPYGLYIHPRSRKAMKTIVKNMDNDISVVLYPDHDNKELYHIEKVFINQ